MRDFALYTLARLGLFVIAFGLVWLVASPWIPWSAPSLLWTALVAMVLSAIASLFLLGSLRDRLSLSVQARAQRVHDGLERARRSEDVD